MDFPGTWKLLDLPGRLPDVVHCHNLHGGYFDLRALPSLSRKVALVLTLHDAWLLGGHCAHSLDCQRWETGCGNCPDLTIPPAIRHDATAYNWQAKREIYARCKLHVATPCRWLMQKVERSMLAPAVVDGRVIPNGVDLSVFQPGDRGAARALLGIAQEARVILSAGWKLRGNVWRDYATKRSAVGLAAERLPGERVVFLVLGEDAPPERVGRAEIHSVPYQSSRLQVARYCQAADVCLHGARADTFPNAVLEALACGTPVVATAVGGIPEQIQDGRTGFLVPPRDPERMAAAVLKVLGDGHLRRELSQNAAEDARRRFDLNRQVESYIEWYQEVAGR